MAQIDDEKTLGKLLQACDADIDSIIFSAGCVLKHPSALVDAPCECKAIMIRNLALEICRTSFNKSHKNIDKAPTPALVACSIFQFIAELPKAFQEVHFHLSMARHQWVEVLRLLQDKYVELWEKLLSTQVYLSGNVTDVTAVHKTLHKTLKDLASAAGMHVLHLHAGQKITLGPHVCVANLDSREYSSMTDWGAFTFHKLKSLFLHEFPVYTNTGKGSSTLALYTFCMCTSPAQCINALSTCVQVTLAANTHTHQWRWWWHHVVVPGQSQRSWQHHASR